MQTKTFIESIQKNKVIENAYSMLASNIYMINKAIRSVVVTSFESKAGKTSVATNLAIAASTWGKRTLLMDLDFRKTFKSPKDSSEKFFGAADYFNGRAELEEVLCKTNINNLNYLGSGVVFGNPMGILCSDMLQDLLDRVKNDYDLVLIDSPSLDCVTDAAVIASKADAVILVAKMNNSDIREISRARQQLANVNANLLGVVLNDVKKNGYKRYFGEYNYYLKGKKDYKNNRNRTAAIIS